MNLKKTIINLRIILKILKVINLKKRKEVFSKNQEKMKRYKKGLEYIADIYNLKSDNDTSDTSIEGKGLKILTNKQMLNRLPILLAQIQAGNNSK